ncbi:DUF6518 family protein [Intrasporangium sp. YIM S08009]|uniref:DUF6518 family protein n=1 Tax=Intrasporangium zincisolvens TaxID=3080018 RepID=UPI002B05FABC|nr:DUF6518 family protein [Intrasporangium sp. YIM S08009]
MTATTGSTRCDRGLGPVRVARQLALALVVGGAWGVVSSMVNVARVPWLQYLSRITGEPWSWCVVAFGIGFALRNLRWSPVFGALGLLAGMVGYYGTDLLRGVYSVSAGVKWDWWWGDLRGWSQVGLVAGAVFALAGAVARRGGAIGALALLALPAVTVYPTLLGRRPLSGLWERPSLLTCLALSVTATSLVLLARAAITAGRSRARRGERGQAGGPNRASMLAIRRSRKR